MHCTVHPGKYCILLPPVAALGEIATAAQPKQQRCRIVMREATAVKKKPYKM
jgi:hypothetical protein